MPTAAGHRTPILIVDDHPRNLTAFEAVLERPSYQISKANSGQEALDLASKQEFAVVLLDVQMPTMDGFEVARRLRESERSRHTPIVFVTALNADEAFSTKAYRLGAVDFLLKPLDATVLEAKVSVFAELYELRKEAARQAAATKEARFRTHFEQAPFSIQLLDPDGKTHSVNKAWKELWGIPEEVVQSYILKDYNILRDAQLEAKGILQIIRNAFQGEASEIPPILYDPSEIGLKGKPRWVSAFIYPVRNQSGQIVEVVLTHTDITKQRVAEDEVRRSRDELKIIFDHVADGILVQDESFKCVYSNPVGARLCGFESPEAYMKASLEHVITKQEIRDEAGNPFPVEELPARRALRGETDVPETLIRWRNKETGEERWSVATARPIMNHAGKPVLAVSIFRDISAQRLHEDTLRQNEERLRLAVETTKMGIWEFNPVSGEVRWDARTREFFGLPPAATSDYAEVLAAIHPGDRERVNQLVLKALDPSGDGTYMAEYRTVANQRVRWLVARGTAYFDQGRTRAQRFVGTVLDITERKRRSENQKFLADASAILGASLDYDETLSSLAKLSVPTLADWCSIAVVDQAGPRTVAVAHPDPAILKMGEELRLKYPPDWDAPTGVGNVVRTGKSELYPEIPDHLLERVAKDPEHFRMLKGVGMRSALIVPLKSRDKVFGALTLIMTSPGRTYNQTDLGFVEELGRRAGIAIDNAILYKQAQEAIQARDEFLSIASHELKTPVTPIKLQVQQLARMIEKERPEGPFISKVEKFLGVANRSLDRLSNLVESLLDVSRINIGKLVLERSTVDLMQVVRDVVSQVSEGLKISEGHLHVVSSGPVEGSWDRFRVEQVAVNLVTNAMKYGEGKPITIEVRKEGDSAYLSVTDKGIGISPEFHDKIFQRFERAVSANEFGGIGLGLFIVSQIVKAHGGEVSVESQPGRGSTFTVKLPLSEVS